MYRTLFALLAVLLFSGCGYLDQDLELSDEEFEAGLLGGSGGSGFGSGSSIGCGGFSMRGVGTSGGSGRHTSRRAYAKGSVSFGEMDIWGEGGEGGEDPDTLVLLDESDPSALQLVAQDIEEKRYLSAQRHLESDEESVE